MADYQYELVDVFTETPLQGNPLAVFSDAKAMPEDLMQRLARELNLSECTFVTDRDARGATVRIFTPEEELPFAGHPALGTAAVLCRDRGAAFGSITLQLTVGAVPVDIERSSWGVRAELVSPPARAELVPDLILAELGSAVGLSPADLDPSLRPQVWSCGNPFAFFAVKGPEVVARCGLRISARGEGWPLGVLVFHLDGLLARARVFIPGSAVPEDPATGSANAPLAAFLHAHGRLALGAKLETIQGVEMGRPSHLTARLLQDADGVLRPRVAGGVVFTGRGLFSL